MTAMMTGEPALKWERCGSCDELIYSPRRRRMLGVCPECGHPGRLSATERIEQLVDPGSFVQYDPELGSVDVIGFADSRPYPDRLAAARERTGLSDAVLTGSALLVGRPVLLAVMDFGFLGGSMGAGVGEAVTRMAERALQTRTPLIVVTASGGARMQEGAISLMQMAKTNAAFVRLREAGVPTVSVLTDPTFGGVTASFATLTDILVAEQRALIGFAGPRVIEKSTGATLPEGFQRAESLLSDGMVDRVESRAGLRPLLGRLLEQWYRRGGAHGGHQPSEPVAAPSPVIGDAWDRVRAARDVSRPTTLDHLAWGATEFVELHGDRLYGDDPAIVGGVATIAGRTVMLVGHQKGHEAKELIARNFGMPGPEGYRKAKRLFELAQRWELPVVTLVDTQGANPDVGAERRGASVAISECIATLAALSVPVVSVITGEGGSGGALALAVANRVLIAERACYSVISPEACSTILFGDPGRARQMATALRLTSPELLALGVVDEIVAEPAGGAGLDPIGAIRNVVAAIGAALAELDGMDGPTLRKQRYERFRQFGGCAAGEWHG
jgi:acyl-CoA carboxylase subunit beta